MAGTRAVELLILLAALLQPSVGVVPKELEQWLSSPSGLAMSPQDAAALASKEWTTLTQCGVAVKDLQALKDVMYDPTGIDLSMGDLRKNVLPLAEQHVNPDKLKQLYAVLSRGYSLGGGLGLPRSEAQPRALEMATQRAEPDQLKDLYQVMFGSLRLSQKTAQQMAIQQAEAGADATTFRDTYTQATRRGASTASAIKAATSAAVKANLAGLPRRYAKNVNAYSVDEFEQYYGDQWLSEWTAGPMEKRVAGDHKAYSASEFYSHYGSAWAAKFRDSPGATQIRLAKDGKAYSMQEFEKYYADSWRSQWASAPELPCSECDPYLSVDPESARLVV